MAAIEQKVRDLCADFLGKEWSEHLNSIDITRLTSGTANRTYRCSLNNEDSKSVVVKIYGSETAGDESSFKFTGESGEAIIAYILSSKSLAPQLLGVFNGGRIEEFIEGKNPTSEELKDPSILAGIANKMVKFHTLCMPVSKRILYAEKMIESFDGINLERQIEDFPLNDRVHIKELFEFPLIEELKWYENVAPRLQSPVVFAHNDVHQFNIMLKHSYTSIDDRVVLIDYELCGYNYRGFDIGYFLRSLCHQLSTENGKHVFKEKDTGDEEVNRCFIKSYLSELKQTEQFDEKIDNFDHLYMEFLFFSLPISLAFLGYLKRVVNTSVADTFESFVCNSCLCKNYRDLRLLQAFVSDTIANYKRQKANVLQKYSYVFN